MMHNVSKWWETEELRKAEAQAVRAMEKRDTTRSAKRERFLVGGIVFILWSVIVLLAFMAFGVRF